MNNLNLKIMKKIIPFVLVICACNFIAISMKAQTNVFHRVFDYSSSFPFDETTYHLMDSNDDNVLSFSYCWAEKGKNLQVGSSSKPGFIKTNCLDLNGNATIKIRAIAFLEAVKYKVTTIGGGEVCNGQLSLEKNEDRIDVIFIKDANPNTQLCIEGVDGRFYLVSFDIISIKSGYLYESFSNMEAGTEFDFNTSETTNLPTHCDNFTGTAITEGIWQSKGCIYFRNLDTPGCYTTPPIAVSHSSKAILKFKMAMDNNGSLPKLTLSCNHGTFTQFNSTDLSTTESQRILVVNLQENQVFKEFFVLAKDITSETQFTFSGVRCYLDDVRIMFLPITIDEGSNNSDIIEQSAGNCTVTLTRTLGAGYWNTLCLPFDITQNSFVKDMKTSAEIRMLGSVNDGVFHFDEVADDFIIEAGTPFIVKVEKKLENPQFVNVVVKNEPAKEVCFDEASYYKFVGTYSPVPLAFDGTNLFLDQNGKLHFPSSEAVRTMKGLRAYFKVPNTSGSTRVNINGEEMDAISNFDIETNIDAPTYDLRGQRHDTNALNKGIYIHDGRKVIVK